MKRRLSPHKRKVFLLSYLAFVFASIFGIFLYTQSDNGQVSALDTEKEQLAEKLSNIQQSYDNLRNQDQVKVNQKLQEERDAINKTYKDSITVYEQIQDLKAAKQDVAKYEEQYAAVVKMLADRKYKEADAALLDITTSMGKTFATASVSPTKPANRSATTPPQSDTPMPGNGFAVQTVQSGVGTFTVNVIAADLNSTKVVVDTANDSDCADNCPVMSLSDFVSRSGAYAGINGSYFCPASYPTCAGKTNSFDTLVMNKNKTYFNSDNNIYSTVPLVVFSPGSVRFVGASSGWGRDTSVDGVIANQPMLVSGGNVVFGGDGDPKKGSKGPRSFVSSKENRVYIGVVNGATVAEAAHVLKAMGMENALNLDSGGSTALWYEGYKIGPGRNIPNAILFVRK
jgi:hypothetical protein